MQTQTHYQLIQGVGAQVFVLFFIFAVLLAILINLIFPQLKKIYIYLFGQYNVNPLPAQNFHVFQQQQCSICLDRIKFKVSPTCGHAICATCLLDIYVVTQNKINCPTCRKPVTTILQLFVNGNPQTQEQKNIIQRIKQYNYLYDDNRGIFRCILQFPYLFAHIRNLMSNPNFLRYLISNVWKFRIFFLLIIYVISPFDILPQGVMGILGLIDDLFIFIIILGILSQIAMQYLRDPHH